MAIFLSMHLRSKFGCRLCFAALFPRVPTRCALPVYLDRSPLTDIIPGFVNLLIHRYWLHLMFLKQSLFTTSDLWAELKNPRSLMLCGYSPTISPPFADSTANVVVTGVWHVPRGVAPALLPTDGRDGHHDTVPRALRGRDTRCALRGRRRVRHSRGRGLVPWWA